MPKPSLFQRKVLLTGWSGFIGRHVLDRLCEELGPGDHLYCLGRGEVLAGDTLLETRATITFLQCDLGDPLLVASVLNGIPRLTHVLHLAAVSRQDADPLQTVRVNLGGVMNLAQVLPPYVKMVHVSSAAVFGDRLAGSPAEMEPHAPTTLYGLTKSLAEIHLSGLMKRLTIVRPVAQCGPGATHGLVRDVWQKVMGPDPAVELLGAEPGTVKPFLLVTDTAEELVRLLWNGSNGVVHLSPGDCMSVRAVVEVAFAVAGIRKPIRWRGRDSLYKGDNPLVRLQPSPFPVSRFRSSPEAVALAFQALRSQMEDLDD